MLLLGIGFVKMGKSDLLASSCNSSVGVLDVHVLHTHVWCQELSEGVDSGPGHTVEWVTHRTTIRI